MTQTPFQDGKIPFKINERHEPCETYYKIYGDLHSGSPPLIVLHGGPGSGHEYVEPYSKIWERYKIPVVFYDQIGCAASTHLPEMRGDKSFWQPSLFVAELQNVINYLHLEKEDGPGFCLLGHSWGAIIAMAFAADRQSSGLKKLILGGGNADSQLFKKNLWKLISVFPEVHQRAISEAIERNDFTTPAYLEAFELFRKTYTCRADPWPVEMSYSQKHQAEDSTVPESLHGRSPWLYNGSLEFHSSIPLLPKIKVSTLTFNGEFDTALDNMMEIFVEHIPDVRWVKFPGASHMIHLDSEESLNKALTLVGDFMQQTNTTTSGE